jgi:hypothetical protein
MLASTINRISVMVGSGQNFSGASTTYSR